MHLFFCASVLQLLLCMHTTGLVLDAQPLTLCVLCRLTTPLQALAVIQHSAALQADAHSQAVASSTLAALVPAWLAAGRGSEELWGSLLAALPGLPAHRRLGLLESLLGALPEVSRGEGGLGPQSGMRMLLVWRLLGVTLCGCSASASACVCGVLCCDVLCGSCWLMTQLDDESEAVC